MLERKLPKTEHEIGTMLSQGLLAEQHYLDIKRELNDGPRANTSLAVDVASFAIDGGALLYGIDEKDSISPLKPFRLAGLKERIDQVVRSRIDGPLYIRVEEIASELQDGFGYLLVIVPPSPTAPHMVDGKYRGRGDTTNTILSDAEVTRIHTERLQHASSIRDLLSAEIARDPSTVELRKNAHLFAVARPTTGGSGLLYRGLEERGVADWLRQGIVGGTPGSASGTWSPDLEPGQVSRRARGWAIHSHDIDKARRPTPNASENYMLDLEVDEDGTLHLFTTRATDFVGDNLGEREVVFEILINGLVKRVVLTTLALADMSSYYGAWDFGVAVVGLLGARSFAARERSMIHDSAIPYSEDEYSAIVQASYEQLVQDPNTVVEALLGRLNRGLGSWFQVAALPF